MHGWLLPLPALCRIAGAGLVTSWDTSSSANHLQRRPAHIVTDTFGRVASGGTRDTRELRRGFNFKKSGPPSPSRRALWPLQIGPVHSLESLLEHVPTWAFHDWQRKRANHIINVDLRKSAYIARKTFRFVQAWPFFSQKPTKMQMIADVHNNIRIWRAWSTSKKVKRKANTEVPLVALETGAKAKF